VNEKFRCLSSISLLLLPGVLSPTSQSRRFITWLNMLSSNEFRLLELLPPTSSNIDEDIIQCRTRVVPVSDDADYEALSYVWGNGADTVVVQVDGHDVVITRTLETALKRMRLPHETRVLWVDQLCINQKDDQEKANQVPLMGPIFSKAKQCLNWFGEIRSDISLEDASAVANLIQFMSEEDEDGAAENAPLCLTSEEASVGPRKAWESICIGENEWWKRMWTLQEAILPEKASVLWGPLSFSFNAAITAGQKSVHSEGSWSRVMHPSWWGVINKLFAQTNGLQFAKTNCNGALDTAFRWSFRKAANPLDKVYGLLGLFPAGTLPRTENIDYSLPPSTVYARFTVDLIEDEGNLLPIALRSLVNLPESTPGIPSWAYDFGVTNRQYYLQVDRENAPFYMIWAYECYNASGDTEVDWELLHYDSEDNTLALKGHYFDEIAVAFPPPLADDPENFQISHAGVIATIKYWFAVAREFYESWEWPEDSPGPESWLKPFWRTVIGNVVVNDQYIVDREATDEDLVGVEDFVRAGDIDEACYSLFATICHRTMFITKNGRLGLGPAHLSVGDEVWILQGGGVPFLLRQDANDPEPGNCCLFVGPSYVDGIMDGEAVPDGEEFHTVKLK
jgi:hypothetical protein